MAGRRRHAPPPAQPPAQRPGHFVVERTLANLLAEGARHAARQVCRFAGARLPPEGRCVVER
eukprot:14721279-Alexandrium_andersonii.AAC.1